MKRLFAALALSATASCASTPSATSMAGCYRVELTPASPWVQYEGKRIGYGDPATSVQLYAEKSSAFLEGSKYLRAHPLGKNPPNGNEYFWYITDGNLHVRLGDDYAGISVHVPLVPGAHVYEGTAEPYVDIGPVEFQTSRARIIRIQCPGHGA